MRDFSIWVCLCAMVLHTGLSACERNAEFTAPAASATTGRNPADLRIDDSCTPPNASQTRVATRLMSNPTNLGKIQWVAGSVSARNVRVGPEQITRRRLPLGTVSTYNSLIPRTTEYLSATAFGFNLPQAARISGIVVNMSKKQSVLGVVRDAEMRLVIDGRPVGDNLALEKAWPTEEQVTVYGAVGNLWGVELTPSTVNAETFGIALSASMTPFGNFQTAEVSSVSTTIHWQCPQA